MVTAHNNTLQQKQKIKKSTQAAAQQNSIEDMEPN